MRLACLLLALWGATASAQASAVKKYVNAALSLYENLEYEKALKQLEKARSKATGPDDEMRVALLEGVVLADMGREEKALAAFKAGFSIDLEARLPIDVSPKVQAVAEKARASVRKLLAPALEAQRAEEARRAAEAAQRAAAEAQRQEEEQRRAAEAQARLAPPPPMVKAEAAPSVRRLAWIPGVVGLASAGAATGLLLAASSRHAALLAGTAPPESAQAFRDAGKTEATLGYVFTGLAAAGVGAAALMFALGAPEEAPAVAVAPVGDGALVSVAWRLDLGRLR